MKKSGPPNNLAPSEYEAIEQAMMETARGRWFLSQFAENCRGKDTKLILEAISKLEDSVAQPKTSIESEKVKNDLLEMSQAIEKTRKEIASLKLPEDENDHLINATEELDAIVVATEKATHQILQSAEDIQETVWNINEDGKLDAPCARIDNDLTDIYTACSFQDITGQRTQKVVQIIRFLESRINAMISIWGIDKEVQDNLEGQDNSKTPELPDNRKDAHLLNGPQLAGKGLGQDNIDSMMAEAPEGVAQDDASALGEVVSDNTDSVAEASHEVEEAETLETSNAEMIAQTSELADTIEEEVSALQTVSQQSEDLATDVAVESAEAALANLQDDDTQVEAQKEVEETESSQDVNIEPVAEAISDISEPEEAAHQSSSDDVIPDTEPVAQQPEEQLADVAAEEISQEALADQSVQETESQEETPEADFQADNDADEVTEISEDTESLTNQISDKLNRLASLVNEAKTADGENMDVKEENDVSDLSTEQQLNNLSTSEKSALFE